MEQFSIILLGLVVVLFSSITTIVKKVTKRIRAKKLSEKTAQKPSGKTAGEGDAESLSSLFRAIPSPAKPPPPEASLRDRMRMEGATDRDVARHSTYEQPSDGFSSAPKRRDGLARVRSLPSLKQAIVWSEILSPPLGERDRREPHA